MSFYGVTRLTEKVKSDAYDGMGREQYSDDPELVSIADRDFDLFLKRKLSRERIFYWAERQREWNFLNGK